MILMERHWRRDDRRVVLIQIWRKPSPEARSSRVIPVQQHRVGTLERHPRIPSPMEHPLPEWAPTPAGVLHAELACDNDAPLPSPRW